MKEQEIYQIFKNFGFLVSKDLVEYLQNYDKDKIVKILQEFVNKFDPDIVSINLDTFRILEKIVFMRDKVQINLKDLEKSTAISQKKLDVGNESNYNKIINLLEELLDKNREQVIKTEVQDLGSDFSFQLEKKDESISTIQQEKQNGNIEEVSEDLVDESKKEESEEDIVDFTKYIFSSKKEEIIDNKFSVFLEMEKKPLPFDYGSYLSSKIGSDFDVKFSYLEEGRKLEVKDFVLLFKERYNQICGLLRNRLEISQNILPINRVKQFNAKNVAIVGLISSIEEKFGNLYVHVEDLYDSITVVVSSSNENFNIAKNLVLDSVVAFIGNYNNGRFYANQVLLPEIPIVESKYSSDDVFVFISDIHVGSKQFLDSDFNVFLKWINQKLPNPQLNELAKKVKAIFIIGDLVDGVGVYAEQEEELSIPDIFDQYAHLTKFLKEIPEEIRIIIIPGNHDAVRLAEPQPVIPYYLARDLWEMKNVVMLSNPAIVEFYDQQRNPLRFLLYHGYSFDYYVATVDLIKSKGGYENISFLMQYLLRLRHLAPTYGSTLYFPEKKDYLVIDPVPHIFVSGHVHKVSYMQYNGVHLICSSTWQSRTSFQEKVGHHPEPSKVPVFIAKENKVKILNFSGK
ncbi:MAG: metallophosphoesterase [Candidatus Woesearchaeota archaeon]